MAPSPFNPSCSDPPSLFTGLNSQGENDLCIDHSLCVSNWEVPTEPESFLATLVKRESYPHGKLVRLWPERTYSDQFEEHNSVFDRWDNAWKDAAFKEVVSVNLGGRLAAKALDYLPTKPLLAVVGYGVSSVLLSFLAGWKPTTASERGVKRGRPHRQLQLSRSSLRPPRCEV